MDFGFSGDKSIEENGTEDKRPQQHRDLLDFYQPMSGRSDFSNMLNKGNSSLSNSKMPKFDY